MATLMDVQLKDKLAVPAATTRFALGVVLSALSGVMLLRILPPLRRLAAGLVCLRAGLWLHSTGCCRLNGLVWAVFDVALLVGALPRSAVWD